MSLLNSKFDIVSVDNPVALASLAQVLEVAATPALNANGTPVAGDISPGAVVAMDSSGKAVLASSPDLSSEDPKLVFVTVDGNKDYSGSFVWKLTVLHGGVTIKTDQYEAGAYAPGKLVSFNAGKLKLAEQNEQAIGFVGPGGLVDGAVEVILPQGMMVAAK